MPTDCCYLHDKNVKLPNLFFRESNFRQGIGFSRILEALSPSLEKPKKYGKINVNFEYGLGSYDDVIKLNRSFLQEFYPYKSIRFFTSDQGSKFPLHFASKPLQKFRTLRRSKIQRYFNKQVRNI